MPHCTQFYEWTYFKRVLKFHIESAFIKDSGVKTELEGSTETENKTPK